MSADPWAAWRALSAWPGAGASPGPAGLPPGFTPQDFVARFNEAAKVFRDAAAAEPAAGPAANRFADVLRDLFAAWPAPAPFGAPAGNDPRAGNHAQDPQAPAFGLTREHQLRWQRLGAASRQVDEAQRRLQRLWMDALRDAGAAFSTALARLAPPPAAGEAGAGLPGAGLPAAGASAAAIRRYYDIWIDCAEDAYSRMAHGSAYCDALADAVNAGSRWRRELQALVEESAKLLDLPSRSEINSLQRRLCAVESELRDARRSAATADRAPPAEWAPPAEAAPRPKRGARAARKPRPQRPGTK